jgi:hypothetical protein
VSAALAWLGIWSLATGWLLLVDFFLPPSDWGWAFAGAGVLLLILPARRARWQGADRWLYLTAVPLALAALIWPLPNRAGPLLMLGGLLLAPLVSRLRWSAPISLGLLLAGAIWIAQGGIAVGFWWLGSRYHEATFLTPVIHWVARWLDWTTGSSQGAIFVPHIEGMVAATTSWERLGAFPAALLAAGGLVLSPMMRLRTGAQPHPAWRAAATLIVAIAAGSGYLLLRYLVLVAVVAISQDSAIFWLPLPTCLSMLPLALLLARVLPLAGLPTRPSTARGRQRVGHYAAVAGLALVTGLALVALLIVPGPARQKAGRVLLDEYNSNWEWSTQAMDTEWYGQKSGYNYYSLGQWLDYYYQVETNFQPRTPQLLADYDVLIIKTPTAPFASEEIEAIDAWVREGGGLFLIGDHTNVFGTSTYLNPLAQRFGLRFRYDSTYDLKTLRVTLYERPQLLAHPAVVHMPPFLFATSCTLEAPLLAGNVMVGYGLRALPVDYGNRVFFPDKDKINDYPFGLFLQSAAVSHGHGRVVAFTDSTVFSNFTMFIAGKSEYFLGVMNWLNRSERWPWWQGGLAVLALVAAGSACYLGLRLDRRRTCIVALGALLLAAAIGPWASLEHARVSYRLPQPHTQYTRIAFDAEHSRMLLPTAPAAGPPDASYQTFYVWTQRLDYVPFFAPTLEEALAQATALVLVDPFRPLEPSELSELERFVAQGGRLLVVAEPRGEGQALGYAGQVLAPFGLGLEARRATTGTVHNASGEALGQLQINGVVTGGEPILSLEGKAPIVTLARHGDGMVVATSFAQPFNDRQMGTTSVIPTPQQRFLFEMEFWLFRGLVEGQFSPLSAPAGAR